MSVAVIVFLIFCPQGVAERHAGAVVLLLVVAVLIDAIMALGLL